MLLMIGFIMITRLSFDKAIRQFAIAVGAMVCSLIIPVLIQKVRFLRKMPWLYAAAGIIGLLAVLAFGITSSGAKISISIAGISVQPSEFVKIIFVFFVACMLYENTDLKHVCIATVLAAVHVLIPVSYTHLDVYKRQSHRRADASDLYGGAGISDLTERMERIWN